MRIRTPAHNALAATLAALLMLPAPAGAEPGDAPGIQVDVFDEADVSHVSRGELAFLSEAPPGRPVHHHRNRIIIHDSSLDDGIATLEQCHEHLDAVPRAQVLYNEDRIRGLAIEHRKHIGEAWVEGASVQLRDVERGAELCVSARTRALETHENGGYVIRNGPFMRQFLDGFYPMRVSLEIELPPGKLRFDGISPAEQSGFRVSHDAGGIRVDTYFEGRLHTEIRLAPLP
jgi:hypothetical protein